MTAAAAAWRSEATEETEGRDDKEELKICGLWRLDPDLRGTRVDDGNICTNGPCWSPDNRTFYLADTFQGEYWADESEGWR